MNEEKVTTAGNSDNGQETSFGKFKSAEELLRAYNALESEFTRKSQKLSEYENNVNWEGKVSEFVKKYPIAEKYAEEVAGEITKNGKKDIEERDLERALLTVLSGKVKTVEEMSEDEDVIDKVLSSDKNRTKVIEDYLEGIRRNGPPNTLPKRGATPVTPPLDVRTIRDAGKVAIKILSD